MSAIRPSPRLLLPLAGGLIALAAVSGLAVAGWSRHGEAILVALLQGAWANCF